MCSYFIPFYANIVNKVLINNNNNKTLAVISMLLTIQSFLMLLRHAVCLKKVPLLTKNTTKERDDRKSGLVDFMGTFVDIQVKCTYLAF